MEEAQKWLNQSWNTNTSILGLAYKLKSKTCPQLQMTEIWESILDISIGLVLFYLLSLSPCFNNSLWAAGMCTLWKPIYGVMNLETLAYMLCLRPFSHLWKFKWGIAKMYQFIMYRPRKFLLYIQFSAIWILFVYLNNQWERKILFSSGCHL